jgi:hypothetical protein
VAYAGSRVRDGENRKVYIILNLPMILIIQKHYCINLQKGIGVKWKLTATATVLKTDPQRNTQEYKKEHVGRWRKNWLPFKQNYLPQVLLISDEFEIPQQQN